MDTVWSRDDWQKLERQTAAEVLAAPDGAHGSRRLTRAARRVLRTFSTSFFIVTRFLPTAKRAQVEIIYAAVRYPDEVVDSFPIPPAESLRLLDAWSADYERGLGCGSVEEALRQGSDCFIAGFAQLVKRYQIPPDYYRSFLQAMRMDAAPRFYENLEDLVESYIYGSATVVGYFLAYVYGPSAPGEFPRAIEASRDLGIALQLTNFLRDVREDKRRGRVYLPLDMLRAEGLDGVDLEARDYAPLNRVLCRLSAIAEEHYAAAERNLDAFSADCRIAIQACINVYRQLNLRIGRSKEGVLHRESVPMSEKFAILPPSKYWRLPLAYMGVI